MKNYSRLLITFVVLFLTTLVSIFVLQNKQDISRSFSLKHKLKHKYVEANCEEKIKGSYVHCFFEELEDFYQEVSLTGVSVGVNFGFEFLEEDKEQSDYFEDDHEKTIQYSLFYLTLNNIAIEASNKRYLGFNFLYGFYLNALLNFYEKSFDFSDNLVQGLESEDGLEKLEDPEKRELYTESFLVLKEEYSRLKEEKSHYVDTEYERLKSK